jgi:hypothetical protein
MRWIPHLRFRLATLLAVLTVACVWLGLVGERIQRQKEAVSVVQRLNGVNLFDYHLGADGDPDGPMDLGRQPSAPLWARKRLGEECFRTLVGIAIDDEDHPPTAADLNVICRIRDLKLLYVKQSVITDADMALISALSRLEKLRLDYTTVTDEGLRLMAPLRRLHTLSLRQTRVTDAGCRYLQSFPSLRVLNLSQTAITNDGLVGLTQLRSLEELSLSETRVDDRALPHLLKLERLRDLDLWHTGVSGNTVRELQAALPHCKIIWDARG